MCMGKRGVAFFNTTGVLIGNTVRNRSCLYGHVRLNGCWGFRPENADGMLNRVFECDDLAQWNGHRKLFLRAPVSAAANPDRYLVAITSAMVGWMDRRGAWRSGATEVISFSEANLQQQALLLMPAFSWVHGAAGTVCLLPDRDNLARCSLQCVSNHGENMRHAKGTITLSQEQDLPMLRQVLNSQFITHTQLWRFMRHACIELSRASFCWRVRRLWAHGFLARHILPMADSEFVYSIPVRA